MAWFWRQTMTSAYECPGQVESSCKTVNKNHARIISFVLDGERTSYQTCILMDHWYFPLNIWTTHNIKTGKEDYSWPEFVLCAWIMFHYLIPVFLTQLFWCTRLKKPNCTVMLANGTNVWNECGKGKLFILFTIIAQNRQRVVCNRNRNNTERSIKWMWLKLQLSKQDWVLCA